MDGITTCKIRFNNQHQSENVVIGSEETILSQCPEIMIVPSFTLN
jgi:hypothetical protein